MPTANTTSSTSNRAGSGLDGKFRNDAARRGISGLGGLLADMVLADTSAAQRQQLTLVEPAAPAAPGEFPCGVEARVVDAAGRLRPQFRQGPVVDLLGWRDGVLRTTLIGGWLVLTQDPEHVGAKRGRCSDKAGFTVGNAGTERICLRPAHLELLGVEHGDTLLLAAIPDERAAVVVNPALLAKVAPPHVRPLLGAAPARHLAPVSSADIFYREAQ